jgi:hypothetical protein
MIFRHNYQKTGETGTQSAPLTAEPTPAVDMIKQPVRVQPGQSQLTELGHVVVKGPKKYDEDTIDNDMFVHHGLLASAL